MMQPMFADTGPLWVVLAVGVVGCVVGFAIIRRITRGPEDGDHWRYRR